MSMDAETGFESSPIANPKGFDGELSAHSPSGPEPVSGAARDRCSLRTIGLYDAYLSTLGGGELVLAVLAEVLEDLSPRARITILTLDERSISLEQLVARFGVSLKRTEVRILPRERRRLVAPVRPIRRFLSEQDVSEVSSEFDLFVNNTIFSVAPPRSRFSIYLCMFPVAPKLQRLHHRPVSRAVFAPYVFLRRRLIRRWLGAYSRIVANSRYTATWIQRYWGLNSSVVYPPVRATAGSGMGRKERSILAVGRFFPGDHNKKHDELIRAFSALCRSDLKGWELHLVGGRTDVPGTDQYIRSLRDLADGLPIRFHFDAEARELEHLRQTASIFWHATGYGEDREHSPERFEHFGISTVEAMARGCVPVAYKGGGQEEIVQSGRSGFLWTVPRELQMRTLELAQDESLRLRMSGEARRRSERFSRRAFTESVQRLLLELVA